VAEIEVDEKTGVVEVTRIYIAHDIGRSLNPVQVEGQVIGGVYMGVGEALMEETNSRRLSPRLSEALLHDNPSMLDYKTLTMHDMPEVVVDIIEDPDPNGPFGAKEVGQGPLLPIMPAIANAIFDAVGVRIDEVPITPVKVLKALEQKAAGRDPRVGPKNFPEIEWPQAMFVLPPWEGGDGKASNKPERKRAAKMHRMDKVTES
jgi:4-hydroxybenzoyl-CoA reductase subunit alpha